VLVTDWRKPGASQTAFVPDTRAVHFWDPNHRLSESYGGRENLASLGRVEKVGFAMKRVIWDAALVYPPGAKMADKADLLIAPVVRYDEDLRAALSAPGGRNR